MKLICAVQLVKSSIKEIYERKLEINSVYSKLISFVPDSNLQYQLSCVEINEGRQKGHTSFIINNVNPGDLIFVSNANMRLNLSMLLNPLNIPRTIIHIQCAETLQPNHRTFRGIIFDKNCKMFIDDYSFIKEQTPEIEGWIRYFWGIHNIKTIIKLG